MRRVIVPAYFGFLLICMFLSTWITSSRQALQAQEPARFFISCSTSGAPGIDTYYTGVFLTELKTRPPRGPGGGVYFVAGKSIDPASVQLVLDRFYAHLKQKGYKFLPGSNYACDIKSTEAEAKAAQHKRAYEGGPSNAGKVVETGWKDQ